MAYIIDGNNLMGQRVGWHRDKPGARRRLLADLARFAGTTAEPVAVVFDGAPDPGVPDGSTVDNVRVYYAARGSDADARIRQLVEHSARPGELTVVTSDRRLADDVRQRGAEVVRSGQLRRQLDDLAGDGSAADREPSAGRGMTEGGRRSRRPPSDA